jgi:putative transcriptional regulator
MNKIGSVLKEKGLKQRWLAEQLGMSTVTINTFVKNRRQPKIKTIIELCRILHVDINELIDSKQLLEK